MSNGYLLTHSYWVNAKAAREAQRPLEAQAMLWGLATSPAASERIRQAAYGHLVTIGAIEPGIMEEVG